MAVKIPAEIRAAITEIARKFGSEGGKTAAKNMTPEQRSARAKKASIAAAKKRTEQRLADGIQEKPKSKAANRK